MPKEFREYAEEDVNLADEFDWMIRPCSMYKAEYKVCASMKGRFNQYYMNGELADCKPWRRNYGDCIRYQQDNNFKSGANVIRFEQERKAFREATQKNNDVWEDRKERPPPNWNEPLPDFILERQKDSYLAKHSNELINAPFNNLLSNSICSIM